MSHRIVVPQQLEEKGLLVRAARVSLVALVILWLAVAVCWGSEKHALLVYGMAEIGEWNWTTPEDLLTTLGYVVHTLTPRVAADVIAEISRLAALSADPSVPGWERFVYYYIGHGGDGIMVLTDLQDKVTGYVFPQPIAQLAFEEIWADSFTFVFDMCDAAAVVGPVWDASFASRQYPVGWIVTACGDDDSTYCSSSTGFLFTEAMADHVSDTGVGVNASVLKDGLRERRYDDEWWWCDSLPNVVDLPLTPPNFPVF